MPRRSVFDDCLSRARARGVVSVLNEKEISQRRGRWLHRLVRSFPHQKDISKIPSFAKPAKREPALARRPLRDLRKGLELDPLESSVAGRNAMKTGKRMSAK